MKTSVLPENYLKCMSAKDRKAMGKAGQTASETLAKAEVKNERDLQGQIVNLLRLRGIEVLWHRTDKKSAATVGWPDLSFTLMVSGQTLGVPTYYTLPFPCLWEVKMPNGVLSASQEALRPKLEANGWRYRVITSVDEALDELMALGIR